MGAWNSGVAAAFKARYPHAHVVYVAHCRANTPEKLMGTTLLIPPQPCDAPAENSNRSHWVACLFTSRDYGNNVDPPQQILAHTASALQHLQRQASAASESMGEWHSAKINSVRFKVPWEQTVGVIEGAVDGEVVVYEYDEQGRA